MSSTMAFDDIRERVEIPPLEIDFSPERNEDYCQFVNEINPLHFDQDYARSLGYEDIVVAGIFTASLFPKVITDWLGKQARIERMEVKFEAPAYLNETVTYRGRVMRKLIESARVATRLNSRTSWIGFALTERKPRQEVRKVSPTARPMRRAM